MHVKYLHVYIILIERASTGNDEMLKQLKL